MKLKSHSQTDVKNNKPIAVSKKKKISIISMPKPNIGLLVEAYFWAELNFFFFNLENLHLSQLFEENRH